MDMYKEMQYNLLNVIVIAETKIIERGLTF